MTTAVMAASQPIRLVISLPVETIHGETPFQDAGRPARRLFLRPSTARRSCLKSCYFSRHACSQADRRLVSMLTFY
jgi:hypothetical protein